MESLAVKNGLVMNDGNVPYFLEGATVTIRCNEGYQVKGLVNYTIYQDVTCFKDIIPKPCVMLRNAEMSGMSHDISLYLSLIVLLSAKYQIFDILLFQSALLISVWLLI